MGQRLVTEFHKDGKLFAVLYQHWDAYTETALENLQAIVDALRITEINDVADLVFMLHDLFGAWLVDEEKEEILKNPKFRFCNFTLDRNAGLIAVSNNTMSSLKSAGEEYMAIDLDNKTVDFAVFSQYDSFAEYLRDHIDDEIEDIKEALKAVVESNLDIDHVPFDKVNELVRIFSYDSINDVVHFKKNMTWAVSIA